MAATLTMKAYMRGLEFNGSAPKPELQDDESVLVEVHAAGINPVDYKADEKMMVGNVTGLDFTGTVVQGGANSGFSEGDEVYGANWGALADFICVKGVKVSLKPQNLSFEQTAALPTAYMTGYQAFMRHGKFEEGNKVLILGASGGCGLAGVQLAKALGASEIVGVCSGKNRDIVMENGATQVIDYRASSVSQEFAEGYFDIVYDCASGSGAGENYYEESESRLKQGGINVILNGPADEWVKFFSGQPSGPDGCRKLILTDGNTGDLRSIAELIENGEFEPILDTVYPFNAESLEAGFAKLKSRRTVGKIVFKMLE